MQTKRWSSRWRLEGKAEKLEAFAAVRLAAGESKRDERGRERIVAVRLAEEKGGRERIVAVLAEREREKGR